MRKRSHYIFGIILALAVIGTVLILNVAFAEPDGMDSDALLGVWFGLYEGISNGVKSEARTTENEERTTENEKEKNRKER